MKPNDIIHLTAFLTALAKLNEPLPEDIQMQLNDVGKAIAADTNNIYNLDAIAESYPTLDKIYQAELAVIDSNISQRNKGLEPDTLPTEPTKELTNAAINSFNHPNSVEAVKQAVNSNLLEQVRAFITGKKTNG
ncbi:hypothetical protein H6G54_23195 [Anabaena cylindrica FACHB-243]|uniref:Uncharacterized protein n=1 Tax=Anabaena cylindrica (strain ATCC 27899 / PCC 7122) TaxID=272123 RepID=K9ZJB6_ANACC|nr:MULTISPECIES: hypothetical protein [Anabaena]AFZ58435.1 hypothetical protein Anacy_3016 [Anabaena cylindrica PCC 7122]MBD2420555.1 hypothetical protein [Anabaena cylindrica FACHB-243]MBY5283652.1 hypothetical protein [Anabaena sp. CCAP 1446/1C]MBY5308593.1 hypothetical protein [Anabaena sp. CCAP 1446/1C]MCM2410193.1 hypothetical protein [Anabaena sp. CCAP 1446/1C]